LIAFAIGGFARALPAQFPAPIAPTSIGAMPVSRSVGAAQAPGESFAMTLSNTVQGTALTIRDSTPGASQVYSGSVSLTPTWDLNNNRVVTIYAYVSQPFTTGSASFASSLLEASATGGTGSANGVWTSFASTVDGHSSAVTLTDVIARGSNKRVIDASERIIVGLRINTTGTYIEAGRYTAVVTFGAFIQ
jgi:hypothetical protein